MDDEAAWDALVGDIYLSATDAEARSRLPGALARMAGGATSSLWRVDPRTGRPVTDLLTNLPREASPLYQAYFHRLDPWMGPASRIETGRVARGAELIADEELARTEYYNDFGRHLDTFHVVGACMTLGNDPSGTVGTVSVLKPRNHGAFSAQDAARLQRLVPHLRRSWQIWQQIFVPGGPVMSFAWDRGVAAVLDGLGTAAVVTDGHGRVRQANAAAERLDTAGALRLHGAAPDRVLRLGSEGETRRLHAAIADAARGGAGMEGLLPLGPAGPCRLTVSPLQAHLAGGTGWVLVLITPEVMTPDEARLRRAQRLFGFTRKEAEVAIALAAGKSPAEIAEERGVRISTIRTQLVSAQEKAGAGDLRGLAIRVTLLRD
ncbi:hypothetical protein VQH23_16865 [Pararoseomonas sp. SCSIO 73927]|uniref:hypothetical protein n=1 Tax=Pararoseomonas sp. SCSIO 73927 TaxID=3114537 RepID=UPI0030D26B44